MSAWEARPPNLVIGFLVQLFYVSLYIHLRSSEDESEKTLHFFCNIFLLSRSFRRDVDAFLRWLANVKSHDKENKLKFFPFHLSQVTAKTCKNKSENGKRLRELDMILTFRYIWNKPFEPPMLLPPFMTRFLWVEKFYFRCQVI